MTSLLQDIGVQLDSNLLMTSRLQDVNSLVATCEFFFGGGHIFLNKSFTSQPYG